MWDGACNISKCIPIALKRNLQRAPDDGLVRIPLKWLRRCVVKSLQNAKVLELIWEQAQSNKQQDQFQTPNNSSSSRSPLEPLQFQVRACLNRQPRTLMQDIDKKVEV
jgi:hypothetical protein